MTHEITGSGDWRDTITSPTTGEAVNQAAWDTPVQDLADSVKYLHNLSVGGGSGVGVQRIRTVEDSAALKALTGITADDVAMIRNVGLFTASTTNKGIQEPFAYTSTGTAGIYWYWVGQFALDEQLGSAIVVTDPVTEKLLVPDVVPNRIVETGSWSTGAIDTTVGTYHDITGDTNWHDVTNMAVSLSSALHEDDIIDIRAHIQVVGDAAGTSVFRANVYFSSTNHEVSGSGAYCSIETSTQNLNCSGRYTVPAGGASSIVVKIQGKVSVASVHANVADTGLSLDVTVIRP